MSSPRSKSPTPSENEFELISPQAESPKKDHDPELNLKEIINQLQAENAQLKKTVQQYEMEKAALSVLPPKLKQHTEKWLQVAQTEYNTAARVIQKNWLYKNILQNSKAIRETYAPIRQQLVANKQTFQKDYQGMVAEIENISKEAKNQKLHQQQVSTVKALQSETQKAANLLEDYEEQIKQAYPNYIDCLNQARDQKLLSRVPKWLKARMHLKFDLTTAKDKLLTENEAIFTEYKTANSNKLKIFGGRRAPGQIKNELDQRLIDMCESTLARSEGEAIREIKLLLSKGADINTLSSNGGYTPLINAIIHGKWETAEYLIKAGANLLLTNKEVTQITLMIGRMTVAAQSNALHFLITLKKATSNTCTIAKYLLQKAPSLIDGVNSKGDTPLHIAVTDLPDRMWMDVLLTYHPNLSIKNAQGKTALDVARERTGCVEILSKLTPSTLTKKM